MYHSAFRAGRWIWYNGEWADFDFMVSVSPADAPTNEATAEYFVAQNAFVLEDRGDPNLRGDLAFVLLGDPDPQSPNHRTPPLTGDQQGRIFVARITLEALAVGTADIRFVSPGEGLAPVLIVGSADIGCTDNCPPVPAFLIPAAVIQVGGLGEDVSIQVALQGGRSDPAGWVGGIDDGLQLNPVPIAIKLFTPGADVLFTADETALRHV